jgi:glyoxylase-like metal-dependent hydrolase (beta-lactamase superfamily II)
VRVERFPVGPFDNNLYLLTADSGPEAIVIDPSIESEGVLAEISRRGLRVKRILLTHAHIDHIVMVKRFHDATSAPVWLHEADRAFYDHGAEQAAAFGLPWTGTAPIAHAIQDGEEVGTEDLPIRAFHTPGHSPGSVTFATPEGLISGDVLFRGSIGRTDLPGGDGPLLVRTIRERLFRYPHETRVLPGHGPETTIGLEFRTNPFVGEPALEGA